VCSAIPQPHKGIPRLTLELSAQTRAAGYSFGFNGKENDNEIHGAPGTFQDYGMRAYDPRIGRFPSVDPLTSEYPWYTPYQFAGNTPIWAIDLDGLEEAKVTNAFNRPELMGRAWAVISKSDFLVRIWNSVNQEDRKSAQVVIYGVVEPGRRAAGGLNGYTVPNLSQAAKFLYDWDGIGGVTYSKEDKLKFQSRYDQYKALFDANGLSAEDIVKEKRQYFGVFMDPNVFVADDPSGARGVMSFLHEIKAHLEKALNGKDPDPFEEHQEFFNYDGNLYLLSKIPALLTSDLSPGYDDIPENSPAGQIKCEIETVICNEPPK
jgi:RHS repeat-associated protein